MEERLAIRIERNLPWLRWTMVFALLLFMAFSLLIWGAEEGFGWLGWAMTAGALAGGILVRIFLEQRPHRLLVAWFNSLAVTVAMVTCALDFDIWLAALGGLVMIGELAVAIAESWKQKADHAH